METDSYVNALRRFICRRGPVRQMRSDNGSNFIGARRELREALAEMDQDQVKVEMLKENCDWVEIKFNVPSASHMGGIWERKIRTVRSVLSALLQRNGQQMNYEALRTFMCEAEAVVNSRPLTAESITVTRLGRSAHSKSLPNFEDERLFCLHQEYSSLPTSIQGNGGDGCTASYQRILVSMEKGISPFLAGTAEVDPSNGKIFK